LEQVQEENSDPPQSDEHEVADGRALRHKGRFYSSSLVPDERQLFRTDLIPPRSGRLGILSEA
jgi:hypothetical protein